MTGAVHPVVWIVRFVIEQDFAAGHGHIPRNVIAEVSGAVIPSSLKFHAGITVLTQILDNVLAPAQDCRASRSEEHTSELQSLMRISYAVFCLKKKNPTTQNNPTKR